MKETPQPCTNCPAKCPEGYNPFNPDCEILPTNPTQQVSFIEIASKIADTIAEHTEEET